MAIRQRNKGLVWAAVSAAVAALLTGIVGVARSAGTELAGCLATNGQLSNVAIGSAPSRPCGSRETQISWNQTGPEGPAGPTGPRGEQGIPGPSGASLGIRLAMAGAAVTTVFPDSTLVGTAELPAGSFLVIAKVDVQGRELVVSGLQVAPTLGCFLEGVEGTAQELDRVFVGASGTLEATVTMTGSVSFTTPGLLRVSCFQRSSLPTEVSVRKTTFVAVKVDELQGF